LFYQFIYKFEFILTQTLDRDDDALWITKDIK